MKKLLVLILVIIMAFAGCTAANEPETTEEVTTKRPTEVPAEEPTAEPIELSILVPFGSPSLAMSGLIINEENQTGDYSLGESASYTVEIVNGADPLVAAFTSQSHDVIVAPTNLGAKFYNSGVPYLYAGAVVYGNLYLASLDTLDSLADLEGKEIVAFSQNATPDVVLQTVINGSDLADKISIRYVGSVNEAQGELLAGTADVALLAEPILSVTKTKAEINVLDLQAEWANVTGADSYPQAGVYVKAELYDTHDAVIGELMRVIKLSVRESAKYTEDVAASLESIEFGLPAPIIKSAIPNSHLVFKTALDSREDLEFYYNKIMELNPKLIGEKLPDDGFYR